MSKDFRPECVECSELVPVEKRQEHVLMKNGSRVKLKHHAHGFSTEDIPLRVAGCKAKTCIYDSSQLQA